MFLYMLLAQSFAIPVHVMQQGRILDADGTPLEGNQFLQFSLYDAPQGGSPLWEESMFINVINGYYSVELGTNPLDALESDLFTSGGLYVETSVNNAVLGGRKMISSVPYARVSEVTESLDGGSVNATQVSVSDQVVIDGTGTWVGPAVTPQWSDIQNIPAGFADGVDNDNDSLANISCPSDDMVLFYTGGMWDCAYDDILDSADVIGYVEAEAVNLQSGSQVNGVAIATQDDLNWSSIANRPSGLDDGDDVLNSSEVIGYVEAEAVNLQGGSQVNGVAIATQDDLNWSSIANRPSGLDDGDDNTQLSQSDVVSYVVQAGIDLHADTTIGGQTIQTGTDQDTLSGISCSNGQVLVYNMSSGNWGCGTDTDTTLTASEVQAMIEAVSGLALQAGATIDGSPIVTEATLPNYVVDPGCSDEQILEYDGDAGAWTCVDSVDTNYFPNSELLTENQMAQLNTWAGTTNQIWSLCYRKSDHGASSSTFHSLCDNESRTYTIVQLSTGKLIGGYSSTSWGNNSGYTGVSGQNFLFSLTNNYKISHCTGQHGCSHPQYNTNSYGPTFGGGHDFVIYSDMNSGYCNLGHNYGCQTSSYGNTACRNDFCGNYSSWTITDMEVWYY